MNDLTDVKIFLASLIEPMVFRAVKDSLAANQLQGRALSNLVEADELLTPEETAQLLKVSKVTVWDWEKRGILNARRIGNQVRYLRSEVIGATKPKKGGLPA